MKRPGKGLAIVLFLVGTAAASSTAQIQPAMTMKSSAPGDKLADYDSRIEDTVKQMAESRDKLAGYDSRIEDAAKQMAETLRFSKVKNVVVLDFSGVNVTPELGARLATEFSNALAAAGSDIPVENRQSVADALQRNQMTFANIRSDTSEAWLARQVGADAFVGGTVGYGIGGLHLALTAYRTANRDQLAIADAAVPVTSDLRVLMESAGNLSTGSPTGQENKTVSGPSCEYCEEPQYTLEAARHKIDGEVLLEITVDVDGSVKDVRVLVGMPYGLTERAVETVKQWRLRAAVGLDGKPVAVKHSVELTFHRYEEKQ